MKTKLIKNALDQIFNSQSFCSISLIESEIKCAQHKRKFYLSYHIPIVIIPQCSTEFLVIHGRFVFPLTPHLSHHFRVVQLELTLLPDPLNHFPTVFVRQQIQQELPQLDLPIVTCDHREQEISHLRTALQDRHL